MLLSLRVSAAVGRRLGLSIASIARHAPDGGMPPRRASKAAAAVEPKEEAHELKRRKRGGAEAASADANKRPAARAPAPTPAAPASAPPGPPSYWLVKSEPHEYSVDDLAAGKGGGRWDGVRNFAARNNLQAMRLGDQALFYHSSCAEPAVVAVARVTSREAYPDPTALEVGGRYYDAKHTAEAPRWFCVDLALSRRLRRCVTLREIKRRAAGGGGAAAAAALAGMALLTRPRLSVQPVTAAEWAVIMAMEEEGEEVGEEEEGKKEKKEKKPEKTEKKHEKKKRGGGA